MCLDQPVTLPCGLLLTNRLAKASTTEQMGDCQNLPTSQQLHRAYRAWGDGGWGVVLTGNVQVDQRYFGAPHDLLIDPQLPEEKVLAAYKELAASCNGNGTPAIVQLNHPGRQSPLGAGKRGYFEKSIAPSAVPMDLGASTMQRFLSSLIFGTPREMTQQDIDDVVARFVYSAKVAEKAGFAGVQIHAAHGYLLAQFLSAKTNLRTDEYGGSPANRAKVVVDIIKAVRAAVPPSFCVALKLNSVDHQAGLDPAASTELKDVLEQVKLICDAGLDFLEISGGSYENPVFLGDGPNTQKRSTKTLARESFFLEFAKAIRSVVPDTVLMVTGGFRTRIGMQAAIAEGSCDLIGSARPAILRPSLPKDIINNEKVSDDDAKLMTPTIKTPWLVKHIGIKAVSAGVESSWYYGQMKKMGG